MDWRDRIVVDANICHGQACLSGSRILVSVVLDNLADDVPTDELLAAYPSLQAEDISAAIASAAERARERTVVLPAGPA